MNARVGQGQFREDLLERWNNKCAVTGCNIPEVLRASHIKAWEHSNDYERLDAHNGILLVASLDALFDEYLVTFTSYGTMRVNLRIKAIDLNNLGIRKGVTVPFKAQTQVYLKSHHGGRHVGEQNDVVLEGALGGAVAALETSRRRTVRVGARLEQQAVASPPPAPAAEARVIALSIDGGHVRSVRSYQLRSFEVMLAQVSNDDGKQIVFSSMPAEADRQRDQLRGVLQGLWATPATPITILSDGADGPRSLGESACVGPTHHVLDWFHLSMRIQPCCPGGQKLA